MPQDNDGSTQSAYQPFTLDTLSDDEDAQTRGKDEKQVPAFRGSVREMRHNVVGSINSNVELLLKVRKQRIEELKRVDQTLIEVDNEISAVHRRISSYQMDIHAAALSVSGSGEQDIDNSSLPPAFKVTLLSAAEKRLVTAENNLLREQRHLPNLQLKRDCIVRRRDFASAAVHDCDEELSRLRAAANLLKRPAASSIHDCSTSDSDSGGTTTCSDSSAPDKPGLCCPICFEKFATSGPSLNSTITSSSSSAHIPEPVTGAWKDKLVASGALMRPFALRCGHVLCGDCAMECKMRDRRCPSCRKERALDDIIALYL